MSILNAPVSFRKLYKALGFAVREASQPQSADCKNISVNSENLGWAYHIINNSTYAIKQMRR